MERSDRKRVNFLLSPNPLCFLFTTGWWSLKSLWPRASHLNTPLSRFWSPCARVLMSRVINDSLTDRYSGNRFRKVTTDCREKLRRKKPVLKIAGGRRRRKNVLLLKSFLKRSSKFFQPILIFLLIFSLCVFLFKLLFLRTTRKQIHDNKWSYHVNRQKGRRKTTCGASFCLFPF